MVALVMWKWYNVIEYTFSALKMCAFNDERLFFDVMLISLNIFYG